MRCKTCDYRLWNLVARRCPECGTAFVPSDYEFIPNSVQFCCPRCNQAYYGTGEQGHLEPVEFDCVLCGQHIHMDETVLLPTEGVREEQTHVTTLPWLEREQRGRFRAWISTIGMALASPVQAMRSLPEPRSTKSAWWFAIVTVVLSTVVVAVPLMLLFMIPVMAFGGGPPGFFVIVAVAGNVLFGLALLLAWIVLWGLVAHGLLRLMGPTRGGMGRTYEAILYGSGANVLSVIPCAGGPVGFVWWTASSLLMLAENQNVGRGRAAFAVLTLPILAVVVVGGLYTWFLVTVIPMATTGPAFAAAMSGNEVEMVFYSVSAYADQNAGQGPKHACLLVTEGYLQPDNLISTDGATPASRIRVGSVALARLPHLPPKQEERNAQAAIDALPPNVVAHRLGDFVFTYHGLNLDQAGSDLWIVIRSLDPDYNAAPLPADSVTIVQADGTIVEFACSLLVSELENQNELRKKYGLPPIPDPSTVTHARPAVANPTDSPQRSPGPQR